MKKILKWTLYILGLAAMVLCFVFPTQAKEVCDNIMTVLNTPFAIAGVTITLGGLIGLFISKYLVNNTKFGRKELDGVKKDFDDLKEEVGENEKSVERVIALYTEKYVELEKACDNKITIIYKEFEELQNKTISALKLIPNKKIQNLIGEYEENKAEVKEMINPDNYVDKKLKEMREEFNELMEKVLNEKEKDDKAIEK